MEIEMKYIRTKDKVWNTSKLCKDNQNWYYLISNDLYVFCESEIIKQADTIEELIQDNDILYIHDLYPDAVLVVEGNIKPFGYNEHIKLNEWLKYKNKFDLYIRDSKGNYIYVAKRNEKGELELL